MSTLVGVTMQRLGRVAAATPAQGRWRVMRGLALAVAALLVPTAAHVVAGGAVPVDIGFILAAAGLAAACVALADRRRGLAEVGAVVLLSQPVMHAVLSWGGHHDAAEGGWAMVAAHLVAGAVVAVLVAGAETMIWVWWALRHTVRWSTTMWADVRRALASTTPDAPRAPRGRPIEVAVQTPASVVLAAAPRRGPPLPRMA